MAAAESSALPIYIPVIVAAIPVILSPFVAWVLGRSGISRHSAAIDYLNKRLDIIERLNKLQTQLAESPIRPFLDTEVEFCRALLRQPPTFIAHGVEMQVKAAVAPQSRWARFFLTQPAVSMRKRIFKGLFYFFFGVAIFAVVMAPLILFSGPTHDDLAAVVTGLLIFIAFYIAIGLLFRLGAR